ncbi:MAG: 5-(carboxyamino)imidazole ribonucleotide mutase [Acidimicrobiia bacterium]
MATNKVAILMGSKSDWPTMKRAADTLDKLGIEYEAKVISAHRMPDLLSEYVKELEARGFGLVIAGAGGAAHLPGVVASQTRLPVFGVPMKTESLGGLDSLLSIVQMPAGVPVGTLAIGGAGAENAAYLAARVFSISDEAMAKRLVEDIAARKEKLTRDLDPGS